MNFVRIFILTILSFSFTSTILSQNPKKQIPALRVTDPPVIDGHLNEEDWQLAQPATDFFQYDPYNDRKATCNTEVKFLYDNKALYIGAMMFDSSPDSILTELGFRDADHLNADYISVDLSTYNDGLNSMLFQVSAAGVQMDAKMTNDDDDVNWNAVWKSEVKILENGWSAEIMIPYSALRFPEKDKQTWGLNIWRHIRRTRETNSWNFVDKKVAGVGKQAGELVDLTNISPPLRLSFTPYVSGYVEKNADQNDWGYNFNYGMDLKYGINESFTLDMTLIPDFGQVQSDDEIYNLTPFEVYYEERRPFFTEGTELFEKGDVFYSRRVGDEPDGYDSVSDSLKEGEEITDNPAKTKLINATKFSGRTNKGLGIGVFNAISAATFATITDSLGNTRKIETQPFTNYNMVVFDQSLKNKSYISLYNTNVYKGKDYYTANVSGTEFQLYNRKATYAVSGIFNLSQKYNPSAPTDLGFLYNASLLKTSGKFRFSLNQHVESDTYDPNDLGYLQANNQFTNAASLTYNFYDPFWKLLWWYSSLSVWHEQLYAPRTFTEFGMWLNSTATWTNHLTTNLEFELLPVESYDYYEPRSDGRFYVRPPKWELGSFISPDYRKALIVDIQGGIESSQEYGQFGWKLNLSPRWRVNDNLTFRLNVGTENAKNDIGYVETVNGEIADDIIFGRRNITNVENILQTTYIFTEKLALDFRLRHYWLKAVYDQYYLLGQDGYLQDTDYSENNDFNFNAFNIDMIFRWEFAPGSELAFSWKNSVLQTDDSEAMQTYFSNPNDIAEYFDNLGTTIGSPADNSLSLKLLYYLDYAYLKKK